MPCSCGKEGIGGEGAQNQEQLASRPTPPILCLVLGAALCKGHITTTTYTQYGEGASHTVIRATIEITGAFILNTNGPGGDLEGTREPTSITGRVVTQRMAYLFSSQRLVLAPRNRR